MAHPARSTHRSASRRTVGALLALALAGPAAIALPATAQVEPQHPVVVTGAGAAVAVQAAGGAVQAALPLVGGVLASLPAGARLPAGLVVTPDRPLALAGTPTTRPQATGVGGASASTVRSTLGLGAAADEGRGVTVAVVDTGVADVPGLAGRVRHLDVAGDGGGDAFGHGTFVAGLVAGSGAPAGPAYAGVAPGAEVLDVRVARRDGSTGLGLVLRGLQAVADDGGVDVVNLSLSSESPLPAALDPLTQALERLQERGVTVVVPSGNDPTTVSSPGNDRHLLTVGGLDEAGTAARGDDRVATWSGRSRTGSPDLVAPGASVLSTLSPGSEAEAAQTAQGLPAGFGRGSGTSFSAAVASGAAAVLLGQRELAPDQVQELLTRTAYRLDDQAGAGAGGLDLAAAAGTKEKKARPADRDEVPGSPAAWQAFVDAVLRGDVEAARRQWSELSPAAQQWSARQWDARQWDARQWDARQWDARQWDARQWDARQWDARQWDATDWR